MRSSTSRHGQAIRFHVGAFHRLNQEVMEGFNAEPRPREVAGLLIGSQDPAEPALIIETIEPVPCPPGPEYPWDDAARQALEQAIAQWQPGSDQRLMVLGYYRSHIRPGLFLSPHDHSLLRTYFAQPNCACLLIKPSVSSPCVGKFFTWNEGFMREDSRAVEFPPYAGPESMPKQEVTATMLPPPRSSHGAPAGTGAAAAMAPIRTPAAPPLPEPVRTAPPVEANRRAAPPLPPLPEIPVRPPQLRRPYTWLWIVAAALAVVILGYAAWVNRGAGALLIERAAGPTTLGLTVERKGSDLRVSWDRGASAVLNAHRGILSITDGGNYRQLEFDPNQLREGSLLYTPESGDVTLRLEIFAPDLTRTGESVRVMGRPAPSWLSGLPSIPEALDVKIGEKRLSARLGLPPAAPSPVKRPTAPAAPAESGGAASEKSEGAEESAAKPAETAAPGSVVLREVPTQTPTFITSELPPSNAPSSSVTALATQPPPAATTPPPPAPAKPAEPKPVELKVVEPQKLELTPPEPKPAETAANATRIASYTGPRALNRVFPVVPPGIRRLIAAEMEIEIKVSIDATGKVTDAEPATRSGPLAGHLGALASSSARLWKFAPANRNGVNIPSEQIIKFVFQREAR